jgi:hypothetical protein
MERFREFPDATYGSMWLGGITSRLFVNGTPVIFFTERSMALAYRI